MAPTKTIYVKEADAPLWERFDRAVNDWQAADSVSALVADAMRLYLGQFGQQGDGLYVMAPDEDPGDVVFDHETRAILRQDGRDWVLDFLDENGDPEPYPLMSRDFSVKEAIDAARKHLEFLKQARSAEQFERIEVDCENPRTGFAFAEAFTGRWLVAPDPDETRTGEAGYDAGTYWGVALTKRGRIAVYAAHCNAGNGTLSDYDDLDVAEDAGVPVDIIAMARAELAGTPVVFERDI